MVLLDDQRRVVDVNPMGLLLLGRRRGEVIGRHAWEFVSGGPLFTNEEWQRDVRGGDFEGNADLLSADGSTVAVQYAAHPEKVTGEQLVLFVALNTSRAGRRFRRKTVGEGTGALSAREREVVRMIALGASGPEIAEALHISHNTVRTHARNAMEKTGTRSRAQLVAKALAEGLLED
jgi:DNA-binding CsgD family transcriptional regulator